MTSTPYNPDQAKVILPYLHDEPDWLILGGPSDAYEAQTLKQVFPKLKVLSVEPNPEMVKWQRANGYPEDGILIEGGIGRRNDWAKLLIPTAAPRSASFARKFDEDAGLDEKIVPLFSIDFLANLYAVKGRIVLWLDIEGMEYQALLGAETLFCSGQVTLVNLEVMPTERPEDFAGIKEFMAGHHYHEIDHWNHQAAHYDSIYVKK